MAASYWTLPRKDQIGLLVLCRLTEPLTFTSIAPYLYYMVRDFGYTSPSTISALVTLVISSFALGQALTGVFWGRFSDKYGRKPALLLGLLGTALSTVIFGLSRNIYLALFGRLLAGMLNGNVGVMRTMIAEIIGDKKEHQTRAFTILPITFNIGTVIGPMAGGLLADPAKSYPSWFGNSDFLKRYPYILPNLFPIPLLLVALLATWIFVEETSEATGTLLSVQTDPGLKMGDIIKRRFDLGMPSSRRLYSSLAVDDYSEEEYSDDDNDDDYDSDAVSVNSNKSIVTNSSTFSAISQETKQPSIKSVLTKPVRITLICYVVLMLHCPTYLQLMPIYLSTPRMPDSPIHGLFFNGGLGWSTAQIGYLMSVMGVTGICLQLGVYPRIANYIGNARAHRMVIPLFPFSYMLTPFLTFLPDKPHYLSMLVIVPLAVLVIIGRTFAIPPMTILMTNAVENRQVLGTVHGLTHSLTSVARCLGPFVLGNLYSLGVKVNMIGLAWWALTLTAIVGSYFAKDLKEWGAEVAVEEVGAVEVTSFRHHRCRDRRSSAVVGGI